MTGKSPLAAMEDQRRALRALSRSWDRGEADRARAILLTLSGWTSSLIAERFRPGGRRAPWWSSRRAGVAKKKQPPPLFCFFRPGPGRVGVCWGGGGGGGD